MNKESKSTSIKTASPYKKNRTVFSSDIRHIIYKKKTKKSIDDKYKTCLNKNITGHHSKEPSFNTTSEFCIKSNKKNKIKNLDIYNKNKIDKKEIKRRRIKTNIFDYIHIK